MDSAFHNCDLLITRAERPVKGCSECPRDSKEGAGRERERERDTFGR
jgi:hypothetical protein